MAPTIETPRGIEPVPTTRAGRITKNTTRAQQAESAGLIPPSTDPVEATDRVIEISDRVSSGGDASNLGDDTSAEIDAMNVQTARLEEAMAAKKRLLAAKEQWSKPLGSAENTSLWPFATVGCLVFHG